MWGFIFGATLVVSSIAGFNNRNRGIGGSDVSLNDLIKEARGNLVNMILNFVKIKNLLSIVEPCIP